MIDPGFLLFIVLASVLLSSAVLFVSSSLAVVLDIFNLMQLRDDVRKMLHKLLLGSVIGAGAALFAFVLDNDLRQILTLPQEVELAQTQRNELVTEISRSASAQVDQRDADGTATGTILSEPQIDRATAAETAIGLADEVDLAGLVVFIHITSEERRSEAQEMTRRMAETRVVVPGVELLSNIRITRDQLRYFHPETEEKARVLADVIGGLTLVHARGYESRVSPNQLEIWLAP
jgi:hypothetical protein